MQISTARGNGTASVTHSNQLVRAAAGVDWSLVKAGNWFKKAGSNTDYVVATDAVLVTGQWQFNLNANYVETTNATESYVIQKDFGPNGEPIFVAGDTDVLLFINRFTRTIAALIASLVTGGSGGYATGIKIVDPVSGQPYTLGVSTASGTALPTISDNPTP
jgi:hypothetical protein